MNLIEEKENLRKKYSAWLTEELNKRGRGSRARLAEHLQVTHSALSKLTSQKTTSFPVRKTVVKIEEFLTLNPPI